MAREYFCAYHSYRAWMEMLSDAEKGRLFDALLAYSESGEQPSLGGREAALFPAMKWNIDRDKKAYEERCETNRENITKRWNTVVNDGIREGTKQTKEKEKSKEKEKDILPPTNTSVGAPQGAKSQNFRPPSVEEVAAYCRERNNGIDPEAFVDHYTARGWRYNGNLAMKDWKAAVRTWEKQSRREENPHGTGRRDVDEGEKEAWCRGGLRV